jgi:hypothetical protein
MRLSWDLLVRGLLESWHSLGVRWYRALGPGPTAAVIRVEPVSANRST